MAENKVEDNIKDLKDVFGNIKPVEIEDDPIRNEFRYDKLQEKEIVYKDL